MAETAFVDVPNGGMFETRMASKIFIFTLHGYIPFPSSRLNEHNKTRESHILLQWLQSTVFSHRIQRPNTAS